MPEAVLSPKSLLRRKSFGGSRPSFIARWNESLEPEHWILISIWRASRWPTAAEVA